MSEIEKEIWNHTARMYVVSNVRIYIQNYCEAASPDTPNNFFK